MTKQHVNFYENIKEANMRINNTVVLYDGEPYYVLCVCDHKSDGIFRVYLDPIGMPGGMECQKVGDLPTNAPLHPDKKLGDAMDEWLEKHPEAKIIRKMMNSPAFNRFRPYPLGMCNRDGGVTYIERQPTRKVEQGLTGTMLHYHSVSLAEGRIARALDITGPDIRATILGDYPSPEACLLAMSDTNVSNTAVAFHRQFALVRGPIDTLFFAYKSDVVGVLPSGDFTSIRIGKRFAHTKEVVDNLNIFNDIVIR